MTSSRDNGSGNHSSFVLRKGSVHGGSYLRRGVREAYHGFRTSSFHLGLRVAVEKPTYWYMFCQNGGEEKTQQKKKQEGAVEKKKREPH